MSKLILHFLGSLLLALGLLLLLEIFLSYQLGYKNEYFIWNPGLEYDYPFQSRYVGDMSDRISVRINSVGARSKEIKDSHTEKIIVIGGSTTECNTVDQPYTWTEVIQRDMSNLRGVDYWVGNFGKSATESHHHILQTKELSKKEALKEAKAVVYLMGFNDAMKALRHPERYLHTPMAELRNRAFKVVPRHHLPFITGLSMFRYMQMKKFKWKIRRLDKNKFDERYETNIAIRDTASRKDILPDLEKEITRYGQNIEILIGLNRENHKIPIFITQPVMWKENLDTRLEDMLVFDILENDRYKPKALAELMSLFNQTLIRVCKANNVHCIDLASQSDSSWFYDDCHFNLIGNAQVGKIISRELVDLHF